MNGCCIQAIHISSGTLVAETLGDTIIVKQQDVWDLTLNTETGLVESWKVNLNFEFIIVSLNA